MKGNAVIICKHVLDDPSCVEHAFKGEPIECADSGWQFLCGAKSHSEEDARVVSMEEIKQMIPSAISILETSEASTFVFDGTNWVRRDTKG